MAFDKQKVKAVLVEISNSMTRMDAEKEFIKDAVDPRFMKFLRRHSQKWQRYSTRITTLKSCLPLKNLLQYMRIL